MFAGTTALLGAALPGCTDRGAEADAVTEAARKLATVGAAGLAEGAGYAAVSRQLSGLDTGEGMPASVGAGLLAQSQQGEGSLSAGDAMLAERSLFDELAAARDLARRWSTLGTTAEALVAYDPTQDLNRIASEAQALAREADARRADHAELAERIDALDARIAALQAESNQSRTQAAELRLAAAAMTAVRAAEQAERIRGISRKADALDMESNRLRGQAETLRPRLAELQGEIDKLVEQRALKIEFGEQLRASVQARAEESVRARAEAAEVAARIDAVVKDIAEQREARVIPASDAAIEAFEKASRSSDKAGKIQRVPGSLSKSSAQRRLAEALQSRGEGHARFAALLEELASASPSLPGASGFSDLADTERAREAEFNERAAEAYSQAAGALRNAGARGPDAAGIAAAADALEALAFALRGEEPPADAPPPDSADRDDEAADEDE